VAFTKCMLAYYICFIRSPACNSWWFLANDMAGKT